MGAFKAPQNRGSPGRTEHIRRPQHGTASVAAGPAAEAGRSRPRVGRWEQWRQRAAWAPEGCFALLIL